MLPYADAQRFVNGFFITLSRRVSSLSREVSLSDFRERAVDEPLMSGDTQRSRNYAGSREMAVKRLGDLTIFRWIMGERKMIRNGTSGTHAIASLCARVLGPDSVD